MKFTLKQTPGKCRVKKCSGGVDATIGNYGVCGEHAQATIEFLKETAHFTSTVVLNLVEESPASAPDPDTYEGPDLSESETFLEENEYAEDQDTYDRLVAELHMAIDANEAVDAERKAENRPYWEGQRKVSAKYGPTLGELQALIDKAKNAILVTKAYQEALEDEAIAKGLKVPDTLIDPAGLTFPPPTIIVTVTDASKIPKEYLKEVVDIDKVIASAKRDIPGLCIEEQRTVSYRRG